MNGYGGKILRVNLTTGKITKEQTPVDVARDFIGGRGFGAYYLFTRKSHRELIPWVQRTN